MKPLVISLYGYKGSGKSIAADYLTDHFGFVRIKFAGSLKGMLRTLGLTDDEIEGTEKEMPCELLGGKTPRCAMQTLGTEWGRQLISKDLWVNAWKRNVQDWQETELDVVVDDMRFPNEVEAVKALGGVLVKLVRKESTDDAHVSEASIDSFVSDYTIVNKGSLEDLYDALNDLMEKVTRQQVEGHDEPY